MPSAIRDAVFAEIGVQLDVEPRQPGASISIDGGTDAVGIAKLRKEQPTLRKRLIELRDTAPCALCGQVFPVEYLVASHIKQRSECTEKERIDVNVATLACTFGCDSAFERGDLWVSNDGMLNVRSSAHLSLHSHFEPFIGRTLEVFNSRNRKYFRARRLQYSN